ncbi:3-dehydroquinate synthase [Dehalococcoides mccartyi]|uniref:3-dehydroquinate synthase n=2 Tax=Dehalococcoides mccartyi TaxID=61435 RepID=UPI0004E04824|nr:3-dehydroquinate synthase [Dehalococcoides mccartyi]AII57613.1 3-dehydroquinate synthase [Dehalococcoides mccartyi CG1]APH12098.1 3-dehydroquinate synthase [Dehalococcoides mccartyi]
MKSIGLNLSGREYKILIGSDLLSETASLLKDDVPCDRVIVITNIDINRLYGKKLKKHLEANGIESLFLELPEGEIHKSLDMAAHIYPQLINHFAERNTPILALGGGVIGDLSGFVAATYQRGVPLIHLPTSLLSQVDSSIGGKVAVNHSGIKNIIGSFYQPRLVISDISCLKTLPEKEFACGMAEIIKSAAIGSSELFKQLETNTQAIKDRSPEIMEDIISQTAAIKAGIVCQDETDRGIRNILNFGHTLGHALESTSSFSQSHGAAVAIGMCFASRLSVKLGLCENETVLRLEKLIADFGLPTKPQDIDPEKIIDAMHHDKKVSDGRIRFILLKRPEEPLIAENILREDVISILEEMK